jgi:CheY-like chemotaxis protein
MELTPRTTRLLEANMPLTGRKIVVTEDEPDQLDFIVTVLRDAGAEVKAAHNGNQALTIAECEKPDLVTLDINMPGKDVMEVLEELHLNGFHRDLKICIISGRPELRQLLLDRFAGRPISFVDKPFSEDQLVEKLKEILDG